MAKMMINKEGFPIFMDVPSAPDMVSAPMPMTLNGLNMGERRQTPLMQRQNAPTWEDIKQGYAGITNAIRPIIDNTVGPLYNELQGGLQQGQEDMQQYVTNPLYERAQMETPGFKKAGLNALGNLSAMVSDVPPVVASFADPYDPINLAGMGIGGALKVAESTQMMRNMMAKDKEISELRKQLNSIQASGDKPMMDILANKINQAQNEREVFTSQYKDLVEQERAKSGFKKSGEGKSGMGVLPPDIQAIVNYMEQKGIKQPPSLQKIMQYEGQRFDPKDASIVTGDVVLANDNNFAHATRANFDKFKRGSEANKATGYGGQSFGDATYFDDSPLANLMGNLSGVMESGNATSGSMYIAKPNANFAKYGYINGVAPFTELMSDMPEAANKIHSMGGYQPLDYVQPVTDLGFMRNLGATPQQLKYASDRANVDAGKRMPRSSSFMIKAALGMDPLAKPARNIRYTNEMLNEGIGGSFIPSIKGSHTLIPNAKEWAIHDPSTMDIVDKLKISGRDIGENENYLDLLTRLLYGKK